MIDRYTKFVLTIIAMGIVALVTQNTITPVHAQLGGGCGDSKTKPCYIAPTSRYGMGVWVENWP